MLTDKEQKFLERAITIAREGMLSGRGGPLGCVIVMDNEIIGEYDSIWQKGNLIIYETTLTTNYIDLKTLLLELLIKNTEKED